MNHLPNIDQDFKALNGELVKDYEDTLQDLNEQQKRAEEKRKEFERENTGLIQDCGLDINRLNRLEKKDTDDLQKYLKEIRPKLIQRETTLAGTYKERSIHSMISSKAGSTVIAPYAASILAPEKKHLKDIAGESGNPVLYPFNPEDINISFDSEGSGTGCWATATLPVIYDVWFLLVPNETTVWNFLGILGFYGFYIMRAHDRFYNCKSAGVELDVLINVHQYFWRGWKSFNLIDESHSNIELYKFYNRGHLFNYSTHLQQADGTWIVLRISMKAHASGGGSYAEINFSDGLANYIKPFLLIANPSS